MIETRCGVKCSECKYKEIMKCPGCLNIKKPYWGKSCPIKNCCERQHKENCGLCPKFPCKELHEFAYDPLIGNEGTRIEQCQDWAVEYRREHGENK
jgi:hypothetical protein